MKIIAYAVRDDEMNAFHHYTRELNLDVELVREALTIDSVDKAKGFDAVACFGSCKVTREVLTALKGFNINYLATRSAGYNHIDTKAAKELGIRFSNTPYSPNSVADFTVMLILMSIRNMKAMMRRNVADDYSVKGNMGKEMHNLTFGIIGTGRIGSTVAKNLSGFGGRILGYDAFQNKELESVLTYTDLDTLLRESDVITLHAPLLDSTYHIIDKDALAKTKEGVVLINCARSELVDANALIEAIESGHIGSAGLDVYPDELKIAHIDHRFNRINNHEFAILNHHKNVLLTPHIAFYTDQAISDMVELALRSLQSFVTSGESKWEIKT